MKRKGFLKCVSAVLALCMILSCVSFSAFTVGAATVGEASIVSAEPENDNFSWDNASVYFLLTDRFKNGNTSNDHSYNRGLDQNGNVVTGIDTRATFHGGDFAGITQTINDGYFNDLGVNALWISAPYEQIHGYVVGDNSSPSFAHYSYHGYYVLDYTQTDANFGTAEEFETLVDTAHEHGLRVILDIVMNHAGYNSIYDMDEYGFGTLKQGWESSYFSHQNVSNSLYHSFIDYDSSASDWANWWGADWIRCGVAGYTQGGGSDLTMSLQGLPDFKTESNATVGIPNILKTKWTKEGRLSQETSELTEYLNKNGKAQTVTNTISYWLSTWVREYGVDGFRCDTAKHVDLSSWKTLKDTCTLALEQWREKNPSKPGADWDEDFWMTGEAWDHNIGYGYDSYFTQGGFDSMINFETQGGGLFTSSTIKGVYNGYASAINSNDKFNQLSYISSHDSTLARGNLISTGSAFLLLPGGIQIFYGDETNRPLVSGVGFDGNGGAGHSLRSDMNWDTADTAVLAHWQKVGTFRNNHISVGAGDNIDLGTTAGYAFGRTYDKNGVSDKIAGCIYAGSNKAVTIDVSDLWADGQSLVNAYDQSSATVTNGKVTFNSGANGTILIEEPDGRPIMSVKGEAEFSGTQTVTVSLDECTSAKCSVDGGNKFIVEDGDSFTIGDTAYDGDTIIVTLEAENEKGSSKSEYTFKKVAQGQETTDPTEPTQPVEKAKITVKTWDGSAPYAYVWTGSSTALNGAWPGKQLTQKDSDGNYVLELDTTETYNVVLNNGSGVQSADLKNLNGASVLEVTDSSYNSKIVSTGSSSGGSGEVTEDSVTIHVKSFDGSAPYIYLWDDNENEYAGAWPGKQLSEKDEDGNYIITIPNTSSVNAIINKGNNSGQTGDISAITGEVLITVTNAECTAYKLEKIEKPLSGMELLRKEAREVKIMTASDYTPETWSTVSELMPAADALIAQGDAADESAVTEMAANLQNAKSKLKLAFPKLIYAVSGSSTIKGVTVPDADVAVSVGGKDYTVKSDDVTGEFVVTNAVVSSSSIISVSVSRNGISSADYSYNMANGNVDGELPTTPTKPTTAPTTAPETEPTTQPTTAPETEPTTQPTTAPETEPTTQPTTAPETEPTTTPVEDKLTVNAESNVFPTATKTFDEGEDTVTVTYKLTANMKAVNAQWTLTYDDSILEYDIADNVSDGVQTICPSAGSNLVFNNKNNYIKGNFTTLSLVSFDDDAEFVSVTFKVKGTGEADVYLDLEYLTLGYYDASDNLKLASIVEYSEMKDISGIEGFENAKITTSTEIGNDILMGDVNGDGEVRIDDVTMILKYAVDMVQLNDRQIKAADVNYDGIVNVKDATLIQKYIAQS